MYYLNRQFNTGEIMGVKSKIILILIGLLLGMTLGMIYAMDTLPLPPPTQYYYLQGKP